MTVSSNYRCGIGSMLHGVNNVNLDATSGNVLLGATVTAGGSYTAALQLINPIIGTLAERALPIGLMSADLRIAITIASDAKAFVADGTPVISITDVEFAAKIVQLDSAVDSQIASDNNGILAFHASDFRHYAHSFNAGNNFHIANIPMRFASVRYALHMLRPAENLTGANANVRESVAGRERATLKKVQSRQGNIMVPQRPLEFSSTDMSQVVVELLNMMGRYQSYGDDQGVVFTDTSLFVKDDTTDGTLGTFLFGLDITAFGGERDDLFNSGANFLATPVHMELTFDNIPHTVLMTTYASFDTLVQLDLSTGLLDVKF